MDFRVAHTWDGSPVGHEPVRVGLEPGRGGVLLQASAPFFNDPPAPPGAPGKPFRGLWDYEGYILRRRKLAQNLCDGVDFFTASPAVAFIHLFNLWPSHMGEFDDDLFLVVEAFFLNDITEQYLEVELCPHGQHLVLLLSGRRNVWKQELALSFKVSRGETTWEGTACIPWSYFPPNVTKFNAFAIHGSKDKRSYEALYPVPRHELQAGQKPDFHRLEYFKPFSFNTLLGEEWKQPESDLWRTEKPDL